MYESELKFGSPGSPSTHVFNTKQEGETKRWQDLKNRVVEHVSNILLVIVLEQWLFYASFELGDIYKSFYFFTRL